MISKDSETFKHWTPSAVLCYRRKMNCEGCENEQYCKRLKRDPLTKLLPIKYAVLVLFSKYGEPKERDDVIERYGNDDN